MSCYICWGNWHPRSISPTYLCTNFTPVAPKSVRIQSSCQYLFTLLGSTGAQADCGTLRKLTPRVNFINTLMRRFYLCKCSGAELIFHQQQLHSNRNYPQLLHYTLYNVCQKDQRKSSGTKAAHRTFMKLTSEVLPTFYSKLLRAQCKNSVKLSVSFCAFVICVRKKCWWNLHIVSISPTFYVQLDCLFCAFRIYERKSCT